MRVRSSCLSVQGIIAVVCLQGFWELANDRGVGWFYVERGLRPDNTLLLRQTCLAMGGVLPNTCESFSCYYGGQRFSDVRLDRADWTLFS